MSISAAAVSSLSSAEIGAKIDMAVARKSLDAQKAMGDAAMKLLESAKEVSQTPVSTLDLDGKGGSVDVLA